VRRTGSGIIRYEGLSRAAIEVRLSWLGEIAHGPDERASHGDGFLTGRAAIDFLGADLNPSGSGSVCV
jgi:hypothetical protein